MFRQPAWLCLHFASCIATQQNATFLGVAHPGGGLWPPNSNSAEIFVQCTYPQVSSSYVYSCWHTHKPTNKQIPSKTSKVHRYATTMGNEWEKSEPLVFVVHWTVVAVKVEALTTMNPDPASPSWCSHQHASTEVVRCSEDVIGTCHHGLCSFRGRIHDLSLVQLSQQTPVIASMHQSLQLNPNPKALTLTLPRAPIGATVRACSHRRQRRDTTVLSCLCRQCEHNCRQGKTVLSRLDPVSMRFVLFWISKFSVILHILETEQLQIGNWVKTRQNCLVLSAVVFTLPTQTRQDSFVLSVSAVWTSY